MMVTNTITLPLIRRGESSYVNGRLVEGGEETLEIRANVQPVEKSTDLLPLAEADRTKQTIKIYVISDVIPRQGDEALKIQPDRVVYDGITYEVKKAITYKMGILNHTKALCVKVIPQEI